MFKGHSSSFTAEPRLLSNWLQRACQSPQSGAVQLQACATSPVLARNGTPGTVDDDVPLILLQTFCQAAPTLGLQRWTGNQGSGSCVRCTPAGLCWLPAAGRCRRQLHRQTGQLLRCCMEQAMPGLMPAAGSVSDRCKERLQSTAAAAAQGLPSSTQAAAAVETVQHAAACTSSLFRHLDRLHSRAVAAAQDRTSRHAALKQQLLKHAAQRTSCCRSCCRI